MRKPKHPVGCVPAKYTILIDMHPPAQPKKEYIKSWRRVHGNGRCGDPAMSRVDQRSQVGVMRTEYLPVVIAQNLREGVGIGYSPFLSDALSHCITDRV